MTPSHSRPAGQPLVAAKPRLSATFDPWNSSSSGHQRPENNPGTGWRESRSKKLNSQYQTRGAGGERQSDTWGAGAEDWDEQKKLLIPKSLKERRGRSVMDMLAKPGLMQRGVDSSVASDDNTRSGRTGEGTHAETKSTEAEGKDTGKPIRGIFDGLVIFVNGTTYPLVSDHKLKQLLSEHGARLSIHLGRRRVSHVIVGRPTGSSHGAGGGLAGTKLEKEIKTARGCGVKFVGVEWVLESIKAGKRLPEARFVSMKVAPRAQSSVHKIYAKDKDSPTVTGAL